MKRLPAFFIALILSSCGFHLRGYTEAPTWLHHVNIIVQSDNRHLGPLLHEQFQAYHIDTSLTNDAKNSYRLIIEKDVLQKQITNVSASTTPRQYLLLYRVQFSLLSPQGVEILSSKNITISRQFTLNNDRILGSNYEEMSFKRGMEREAASQIIQRLSAVKDPGLQSNSKAQHAA